MFGSESRGINVTDNTCQGDEQLRAVPETDRYVRLSTYNPKRQVSRKLTHSEFDEDIVQV